MTPTARYTCAQHICSHRLHMVLRSWGCISEILQAHIRLAVRGHSTERLSDNARNHLQRLIDADSPLSVCP